jgi:hypothetical protein
MSILMLMTEAGKDEANEAPYCSILHLYFDSSRLIPLCYVRTAKRRSFVNEFAGP